MLPGGCCCEELAREALARLFPSCWLMADVPVLPLPISRLPCLWAPPCIYCRGPWALGEVIMPPDLEG